MVKRWLFALVALGVLVGSAGVAATVLLRSGSLKAHIEQAAFRATGRRLTITGKVRPLWGFTPGISMTNLSLANLPGGSRPEMVTIKRIEARLALVPLLRGQVEITAATLVDPDLLLERDATGTGNWLFRSPPAPPSSGAPALHRHRTFTRVDTLRLEGAHITARNLLPGRTEVLDLPELSMNLAAEPVRLGLEGQLNGAALSGELVLGRHQAGAAYPINLTLTTAGATLAADGAYDPAANAIAGKLVASAADTTTLEPLVGARVPKLQDVRVTASVSAMPLANFPSQPVRIEAAGALPAGPWQASASIVPVGSTLAVRGLQASGPMGDVSGDVAYTGQPRPTLRGTLVSNRLDANAFSLPKPIAPPVPMAEGREGIVAPPPSAPATEARLIPDTPLPWPLLRMVDADLQLSIATLHAGTADYRNATGHLTLNDGALTLSSVSLTAPEGPLAFSATANAQTEPHPVAVALRSPSFAIDTLLQAFRLPPGSTGAAELDVALHAAGDTPRALAASLTGHAGIALVDGTIANADLAAALGEALRRIGLGLEPGGQSPVRCLAVRLNAQSGRVTLAAFKLDTARLMLDGSGLVDLASETLALELRPFLRLGSTGVAAPLRVGGTLLHPAVALESPSGESGRSGITIGGPPSPPDDCAAALTAARDGRPGPMPTAVALKSVKPADLLRSLLR